MEVISICIFFIIGKFISGGLGSFPNKIYYSLNLTFMCGRLGISPIKMMILLFETCNNWFKEWFSFLEIRCIVYDDESLTISKTLPGLIEFILFMSCLHILVRCFSHFVIIIMQLCEIIQCEIIFKCHLMFLNMR